MYIDESRHWSSCIDAFSFEQIRERRTFQTFDSREIQGVRDFETTTKKKKN